MLVKVLRAAELAVFPIGRGESVKVRIVECEGVGVRLDLRRFFTNRAGQTSPTGNGVAIGPAWAPKIREALDLLEREAATK